MTDPFIPTGRELDEGVTGPGLERQKTERPGFLRRIFGRGTKHTGKNLTEVELTVPDSVASKLPRVRKPAEAAPEPEPDLLGLIDSSSDLRSAAPRDPEQDLLELLEFLSEPEPAPAPQPPKAPRPAKAPQPARAPRAKPSAAPAKKASSRPSSLEAPFAPTVDFLASLITLSRAPGGTPSSLCRAHIASHPAPPEHTQILLWWTSCESTTPPEPPSGLTQHLTNDIQAVVEDIMTRPTTAALAAYQRDCDGWDRLDESVKTLSRKARSYSSLQPLVDALNEANLDAAKRRVDYDSASWHECRHEIASAMSALEEVQRLGPRPPMAKLPRTTSTLPLLERAVISTLCVPSSLGALHDTCRDILKSTDIPQSETEVLACVAHLSSQHRGKNRSR
jgi:hypothetical protein